MLMPPERVDAVHRAVAASVPRAAFVSAGGPTGKPDNLHFDSARLREFGRRCYTVFRARE